MNRSKLKKKARWLALCLMAAWLVSVALDWGFNRSLAAVAVFLWASIAGLNTLARIVRRLVVTEAAEVGTEALKRGLVTQMT